MPAWLIPFVEMHIKEKYLPLLDDIFGDLF